MNKRRTETVTFDSGLRARVTTADGYIIARQYACMVDGEFVDEEAGQRHGYFDFPAERYRVGFVCTEHAGAVV